MRSPLHEPSCSLSLSFNCFCVWPICWFVEFQESLFGLLLKRILPKVIVFLCTLLLLNFSFRSSNTMKLSGALRTRCNQYIINMTFIQLFNSFSFTSIVEDTHCPNNCVMCANSCCNNSKVKWKYLSDVEAFLYSWFDFAANSNFCWLQFYFLWGGHQVGNLNGHSSVCFWLIGKRRKKQLTLKIWIRNEQFNKPQNFISLKVSLPGPLRAVCHFRC